MSTTSMDLRWLCDLEGLPAATDGRAGLRVMTVLEAATRSLALEGAFVSVEDVA
jgi:hypothetical protein